MTSISSEIVAITDFYKLKYFAGKNKFMTVDTVLHEACEGVHDCRINISHNGTLSGYYFSNIVSLQVIDLSFMSLMFVHITLHTAINDCMLQSSPS